MEENERLAGYEDLLQSLKTRIQSSQVRAAVAVTNELVTLYWHIGREILERQSVEGWGAQVIDRLSRDLKFAFPGRDGFSQRNLRYMRKFAEIWPDLSILQRVVAQLPWGHQTVLIDRLETREDRLWYAQMTSKLGWSRTVLEVQIETGLL